MQWEGVQDPSPTESALIYCPSQDPDVVRRNATGEADTHRSLSGESIVGHQPQATCWSGDMRPAPLRGQVREHTLILHVCVCVCM